jgi:ectoine hydroxylase
MTLTEEQIAHYNAQGYLFVPEAIPAAEIAVVRNHVADLVGEKRDAVIAEADGKTIRSVLNGHLYDDILDRFIRHEAIIEPAMQLVGTPLYTFQSILNVKRAFDGAQWQWHQDYPTYKVDDGMKETRAVNAMIFVDEVTEFNGPLMMVPASHASLFMPEIPEYDTKITTSPNGLVAPKGPAGSIIFMHLLTVHGSGPNMSPWHRSVMSLTLNSVENKAEGTVRGRAVCHDYTPIRPLPGSALLELAA